MRTLSGMTLSQSKQLYVDAGGPSDHSQSEWDEIHEEMQAIVAAKSDRDAAKVIDWWRCWDRKYTATAFARRVRASPEEYSGSECGTCEEFVVWGRQCDLEYVACDDSYSDADPGL